MRRSRLGLWARPPSVSGSGARPARRHSRTDHGQVHLEAVVDGRFGCHQILVPVLLDDGEARLELHHIAQQREACAESRARQHDSHKPVSTQASATLPVLASFSEPTNVPRSSVSSFCTDCAHMSWLASRAGALTLRSIEYVITHSRVASVLSSLWSVSRSQLTHARQPGSATARAAGFQAECRWPQSPRCQGSASPRRWPATLSTSHPSHRPTDLGHLQKPVQEDEGHAVPALLLCGRDDRCMARLHIRDTAAPPHRTPCRLAPRPCGAGSKSTASSQARSARCMH